MRWRLLIWACAITVLIMGVFGSMGLVLAFINMHQSLTLFGDDSPLPQPFYYETTLDLLLELPFVLAQFVLGIWAIKQLRKIDATELGSRKSK